MLSRSATITTGAALVAAATAGVLSWATVAPAAQLFGPTLQPPRRPRDLAFTFDDGPNPAATPALLDLLALHNVRATFFLIGRYARRQGPLARRVAAAGHALGNHTMTHPRLPLCSHHRIREEIRAAQHSVEDVTGVRCRLFRPPHGFRTPYVLRTAREFGLTPVLWNHIGYDWSLPTAEAITARVERGILANQRRGVASNIALHDGSQLLPTANRHRTIAAMASLLTRFAAEGAAFVTLSSWL